MLCGGNSSLLLWLTFVLSLQCHMMQTRNVETYVAAVVEYSPDSSLGDVGLIVEHSIQQYEAYIEQAASQEADIIVFPECGIQGLGRGTSFSTAVPPPDEGVVPCAEEVGAYSKVLTKLSCAAIRHRMYVVANLPEASRCDGSAANPTCSSTVVTYYNTNVAFDRNGAVVARYRKFHLFGEPGFSSTPFPEMAMFDTDFGVRFGIFTCFDIMFDEPALSLVNDHNITDIIFPTAWFSETPFLTAVQTQTAWAAAHDVNLLAAGYDAPHIGSAGSGIYEGRHGAVIARMPVQQTSELLVGTVRRKSERTGSEYHRKREEAAGVASEDTSTNTGDRKDPEGTGDNKPGSGLKLLQDDLSNYETLLLEPSFKNVDNDCSFGVVQLAKTICHARFCCEFNVSMTVHVPIKSAMIQPEHHGWTTKEATPFGYYYRLVAFDGVRTFSGIATAGVQVCAVVACSDRSEYSCGILLGSDVANTVGNTTFPYIRIKAKYRSKGSVQFPNTLMSKFGTMHPGSFEFKSERTGEDTQHVVTMYTENVEKHMFTFGIYGRDFTKDGKPKTQSKFKNDEF